jgi:drug/metabolite transporter (DMT)-like permease
VLFCAATLAVYFLINERVGRDTSSTVFTTWAMSAATGGLVAHFALSPGWAAARVPDAAWPLLIGLIVVATVAPLFMVAEGVRRIGAARAALVTTVGPVGTLLLAWLVLGERLTGAQLFGAGLIIVTIAWLERPRAGRLSPPR